MVLYIIVSLAAPICLVVIVINCLNCFSRKKAAFTSFENTVQSSNVQHNEAFTMEIPEESSPTAAVVIEPLPDILAKTSAMPSLRPRIICTDRSKQESMLISLQRSFPRDQLVYLNEIGEGWFGQAIESEALNTSGGKPRRSVVVKRLKDDASKFEQKQFLDEVTAFRCLEHPNLLGFVGQCTEVSPYLTILEAAPHGNLKAFLLNNKHEADRLVKNNSLVNFSLDIAAGLACLHRNDYVHNDIASRNCLLMDDMSVKIGDYGISDTLFKEDYCNTGQEMLPIRWMAPETLIQAGDIWTLQQSDSISDMWSFGILLWELFSLGERPYDMLTDEAVLQGVVLDRLIVPSEIEIKMPSKDYVNSVMQQCWKHPSERLEIEQAYQQLEVLARQRVQTIDAISDFDHKWSHLMPNSKASRTSSADSEAGSRTALAGSFETNNSSSPDDKSTVLTSSETNITGVAAAAKSVEPTVTKTRIKVAADMDSDSSNLVVKTKSDLQSAKADLPDKSEHESPAIVTNGVAKVEPLLEPSITPVKSSSMQVQGMLTSTPLTQNQNSVSQLYSPDASKSSEYVTANETPEALNINSNQLSSLGIEFSLDSNDMSFHEFEETIQEDTAERNTNGSEGKNTAASTDNQNDKYSRDSALDNSNNNGTSDQFEPAVERGSTLFGEFVRTSPTSPRGDFTDFVDSQDSDNIKDNIPVATDHLKEDTTIKAFAAEDITLYPSASPKQLLDVSMSDTWDSNTGSITSDSLNIAENDILNLSAPQSIIVNDHPILNMPISSSSSQQDLAQTVTGQNDFSIPKNVFTKEEDGSNQVQLGMSDIHIDIGSFPLSESIEDIVETGDVPAKTSNEQVDNAINVELMDAGIDPAPPNSWMDSEPPTLDEAPSLPSKSENFFVIDTTEQPVNETAFSDLRDQMDDFEFLEPLKPEVPSISAALEDNKNELLLALEDNSNGFSFVQSSDQNPTISSGDQDMLLLGDDFSTIVVPQKETHDDTVESTPSDRIVDLPGLLSTTSSDESGVDGQPKASDVNESAANPPQSVQDGQLIDF